MEKLSPDIRKMAEQMQREPEKEKFRVNQKDLTVDLQAGARREVHVVAEERKSALGLLNRAMKNFRVPSMPHAMHADMERRRAREKEMGITR
jgi:hypothetical protein